MEKKFLNRFLPLATLVCSFMVVGIHSYNAGNFSKMDVVSRLEGFLAHGVFMSAVPIFFFISAYLFYRNTNSMVDIYGKMKRRINSVLIPFLAWSTIYYVFYAVGSKIFALNTVVDVSIGGLIKGIIFYEYVFPMWFMFMLVVFTMLAPLLMKILHCRRLSIIILIVSAVLGALDIDIDITIGGGATRTLFAFNYFFYYWSGAIFAKYVKDFSKVISVIKKIPIVLSIIVIIIFSILETTIYDLIIPVFNIRIFVPIIALGMLVLLIKLYDKVEVKLNVSTMLIYGIHPLIGILIGKTIWKVIKMPALGEFFFSWIINIFLSCIIAIIIRKIRPLNRILSGNR
ncbi:MAG: acyltransferase [Bacillota bacterium]|nr:acyltransferase [Bacillota bacterium]